MNEVLLALIAAINPAAVPLVATIVLSIYMYFKFKKVESDRKATKASRDEDSQNLHDAVLKHTFQIDQLVGSSQHHEDILDDLRNQLNILNTNIAKLSVTIDNMYNKEKK